MIYRASVRNKLLIRATALSVGTAAVLVPKRNAFAEERISQTIRVQAPEVKRKPIYDDDDSSSSSSTITAIPTSTSPASSTTNAATSTTTTTSTSRPTDADALKEGPPTLHPFPSRDNFPTTSAASSSTSPSSSLSTPDLSTTQIHPIRPTPTDRLAAHIARTRLTLYHHLSATEHRLNTYLSRALDLETSFTSTIASLAPPPASGERVLPGLLYVLVAGMAGSIVSRNRTFILRFATPVAFAVGMGYAVVPRTMENVGDLVGRVERRFAPPVVRDMQGRIGAEVERVWETGKAHSGMAVARMEEGAREVREGVESWVKRR